MTAATHREAPDPGWTVGLDDPFALPERLAAGVDPTVVSRYGDSQWVLNVLGEHGHSSGMSANWNSFPDTLREPLRRAGWVIVNLPTPEELLDRARARRVEWQSPSTLQVVIENLRKYGKWLAQKGITALDQVDESVLEDYAGHIRGQHLAHTSGGHALYAVSRLWGASPHLPPGDRISMPPWEQSSRADFLPIDAKGNGNSTEPIHPAVMAPLLIWALWFIEFADDILAGWQEYQRLNASIRDKANPAATDSLKALVERRFQENKPLPGVLAGRGGRGVAITYLAALHHASTHQVYHHVTRTGAAARLGLTLQTPMDTPITGRLHGRPWKTHINFYEAPILMRHLSAAALIVVSYLSGLRPAEAVELEVGCCPEHQDIEGGPVRYELHGNFFKGARDEHGKLLPEGKRRELPWTTIRPVAHAISVMERFAATRFLFPAEEPWNPSTGTSRQHRNGEVITVQTANTRIAEFISWVNAYADEHGLGPADRIPADPHGAIVIGRFRQTVGWHIARLPGGQIALATQYGHLRTRTSDGYSYYSRQGLRRVLDIETARATADYLQNFADRFEDGEGISGPASSRMIRSARAAQRFRGKYLDRAEVRALTRDPEFQVFDNPDAFLTCNKDPSKALCDPHRDSRGPKDTRPPSLDRCNPACSNIARTDEHIAAARAEITRLTAEADDPLTPIPLAQRLKQRISALQAIVQRHEQYRTTPGSSRRDRGPRDRT